MKNVWNTSTIEEVCSLITDGAHNSPKSVEEGEYMASVKDFTEYGFDFSSCRKISVDDYKKLQKQGCVPQIGDVLVGKDGARFFEDIIIYNQEEKPALLSSIAILRVNNEIITPEFLYYTLKSPLVKKDIRDNYGSGSAIPRIVLKDFKRMPISFPDLNMQRRITSICELIDRKIINNMLINDNLTEQARAVFQAWFIDYELFGGAAPSDWHLSTLGQIAEMKTDSWSPVKNPDVVVEHYSIPAFDEQHYPVFEIASGIKSNKYILNSNSVMISKLNPDTKRIWRPMCLSAYPVCSTEFIVYEAKKREQRDYIYSILDSVPFLNHLCSHATGSTNSRQRATPKSTLDFTLCLPPDSVIEDFCQIVTPMYDLIASNIVENQLLAKARDSLLPRLMFGELDVSDLEL